MSALDVGLGLLEGMALVVSPCILPVLPLVLGASIDGARRRPYGIIVGFVATFTLFAIAARKIVTALGIDLDTIKVSSLVFLALFGMILLSGGLSRRFGAWTQGVAGLGNRLASSGETAGGSGFWGGTAIGSMIGFVWTPCAGPILAAVLVQVIRQRADLAADAVIFAFALGAGLPMLAIAIAGRKLINRLRFLTAHAEWVRRGFGALILGSVAYLASGTAIVQAAWFSGSEHASAATASTDPSKIGPTPELQHGLAIPYRAPEFSGIAAWLNSTPLTMASLRGKVVLVDFWTYSCINCVRTLPYLTEWDKKYRADGLVIVGVQAPEFEFEKRIDNVKAAIARYGIRYPVALDNNLDTWTNFRNLYWPAHYLIDRNGRVVYTHFGEGDYGITENNIRALLGLNGKAATKPAAVSFSPDQTPETYLGYERGERYAGANPVTQGEPHDYHFPSSLPVDSWALRGSWKVGAHRITALHAGAAIRLRFTARKVYLVLGTGNGTAVHATVTLNGKALGSNAGTGAPGGTVTIAHDTLYELIDQGQVQDGVVEIRAQEKGVSAYAFTFGS